jgi:prepilin-type processing-associated H-X9-DG protein
MIFDAGKYVLMPANIDARDTPGAGNYGHFIPGQGKETAQGAAACGNGFGGVSQNDCNTGRHFDGVNVGFADGHVKWLRTSKVIAEAMKYTKGSTLTILIPPKVVAPRATVSGTLPNEHQSPRRTSLIQGSCRGHFRLSRGI